MMFGFVRYPDAATWAAAAPFLQAALDHADDGTTLAGVRSDIDDGCAQLWIDAPLTGACVTRRCGDTLEVWLMGGTVAHLPLLDTIMDAARRDGCTRMTLDGRPGWQQLLPDWRVRTVHMEIAL